MITYYSTMEEPAIDSADVADDVDVWNVADEWKTSGDEWEDATEPPEARTVNQNRKAFVKWVNEDLYQKALWTSVSNELKVYQVLVQKYLALETPYRGLLVYHGLGTGKTATAVSLAESLSAKIYGSDGRQKPLPITTILPASLETEFVKEVRRWGLDHIRLYAPGTPEQDATSWYFRTIAQIKQDPKGLRELKVRYGIDTSATQKINRLTRTVYRKELLQTFDKPDTDPSVKAQLKQADKKIQSYKGVWLPGDSAIGGPSPEEIQTYGELTPLQQACILQQVNWLISKKYNFIHYRPFPKVSTSSIKAFLDDVEGNDDEMDDMDLLLDEEELAHVNTHNQDIVQKLERDLRDNRKVQINSPFYNQVVIVDEVHNFVRQILNKSKPSLVFYEWLVNARNVKLVFLSGTPVINKPCEIAILYNMLYGLIRIYSFTVETAMSPEEMTGRLQELIYDSPSPIEMFYVDTQGGKLIISFIQETNKFESVRGNHMSDTDDSDVVYTVQNHTTLSFTATYDGFFDAIYEALNKADPKANVRPSRKEYKGLNASDKSEIRKGTPRTFDTDTGIQFNRQQKLFDIYEHGKLVDMTNDEHFMNYFFESTLGIPNQKRTLLKRMLMGMTSYYPIDRTSIVDMPRISKPTFVSEDYQHHTIVKDLNIVACPMSRTQFGKYYDAWSEEKKFDKSMLVKGKGTLSDDTPHHYQTRTRQASNIVFRSDDFRTQKNDRRDQAREERPRLHRASTAKKSSTRRSARRTQSKDVSHPQQYGCLSRGKHRHGEDIVLQRFPCGCGLRSL